MKTLSATTHLQSDMLLPLDGREVEGDAERVASRGGVVVGETVEGVLGVGVVGGDVRVVADRAGT